MATAPYKIIDRRSSTGYSNNSLIASATQQSDRKSISPADYDFHRNVSAMGRRTLMSLGRWMFWNLPELHGAILEQVNLAVSSFIPQYYGRNREWGDRAEAWLEDWHRVMDVAGPPYDYETYVQFLILEPIVGGEIYTLLTQTSEEYPQIQTIPCHRVGGRYGVTQTTVQGGPYDGARIIDGVIVNDVGRAVAYRVYSDNTTSSEFQDIPARDMFPTFVAMGPGQLRGLSLLTSGAFNFQDREESKRFEMLAQKASAAQGLIEQNETGEVDSAKEVLSKAATFDDDGKKTALAEVKLEGGAYRIFKAGTGSSLQAFHYDRPGANSQRYQDMVVRDAFRGTEWDSFFSLDPQKVGGAPMRVIVEKINAVLNKRRRMVERACRRVDGYAISRAVKLGILPPDEDWYKWEYQGPGDVTADRKYDSDVDLQEIAQGVSTRKRACAKRGLYIEDVDKQRESEARSDLQRAQRLAKEFNISIQEALVVLRPPTPNAQLPQSQQQDNGGDSRNGDGATDE